MGVTISSLPLAATLDGSEVVPLVQSGVTKQVATDDIANLVLPIITSDITDGAVTTAKVADANITLAKLASSAYGTSGANKLLQLDASGKLPAVDASLITQLGSNTSFASSIATLSAGYQKLPSGLIIQWGGGTSSGTGTPNLTITYPTAFPNAGLFGIGSIFGSGAGTYTVQVTDVNASQLQMLTRNSGTITSGVGVLWFAIGF